MRLILRREPKQPDAGCTLGLMFVGSLTLCTLELPWIPDPNTRGGLDSKSCVPLGTYRLERHNSDAHPYSFALVNPDLDVHHYEDPKHPELRALVLIHVANWAKQLQGCIAVGTRAGRSPEVPGVYQVFDSKKAMRLFNAAVPWIDGHTLEISEGT